MENINESNLIEELKKKNTLAYEYVIKNYSYVVKSVALKFISGNTDYLDDIYQETYLALYNNIGNFDEKVSSFKNYLAGIARFKSIDVLRRIIKTRENEDTIENNIISIEDQNLNALYEDEVFILLSELNEVDREIFKNYFLDEIPIRDIAKKNNLSEKGVYSKIRRSRERLRNVYEVKEAYNE